jgi:hypothetical protein
VDVIAIRGNDEECCSRTRTHLYQRIGHEECIEDEEGEDLDRILRNESIDGEDELEDMGEDESASM